MFLVDKDVRDICSHYKGYAFYTVNNFKHFFLQKQAYAVIITYSIDR